MLGQALSLEQQISELSEMLAPSAVDIVPQCLHAMKTAGMALPSTIKPEDALGVYRFAVERLPAAALSRVTGKLMRGEYDRSHLGLIPTPPELAALVRSEAGDLRADLIRLRGAKQTLDEVEQLRQPRDEAEKQRVRELIERSRRGFPGAFNGS